MLEVIWTPRKESDQERVRRFIKENNLQGVEDGVYEIVPGKVTLSHKTVLKYDEWLKKLEEDS
jgi:hypothetical protein